MANLETSSVLSTKEATQVATSRNRNPSFPLVPCLSVARNLEPQDSIRWEMLTITLSLKRKTIQSFKFRVRIPGTHTESLTSMCASHKITTGFDFRTSGNRHAQNAVFHHHLNMKVLDHVMPREKRWGALDSCFGLVSPHQQSIPQLLSLASRVYKGYQECSTCGSEHPQIGD
jgi:hypothetical protein